MKRLLPGLCLAWLAVLPAAGAGSLRVVSQPGVEVLWEGVSLGRTDDEGVMTVEGIPEGSYAVELRKSGFEPVALTVEVEGGQQTLLLRLEALGNATSRVTPAPGPLAPPAPAGAPERRPAEPAAGRPLAESPAAARTAAEPPAAEPAATETPAAEPPVVEPAVVETAPVRAPAPVAGSPPQSAPGSTSGPGGRSAGESIARQPAAAAPVPFEAPLAGGAPGPTGRGFSLVALLGVALVAGLAVYLAGRLRGRSRPVVAGGGTPAAASSLAGRQEAEPPLEAVFLNDLRRREVALEQDEGRVIEVEVLEVRDFDDGEEADR